MLTYSESLALLFNAPSSHKKELSLEVSEGFYQRLGAPAQHYPVIHVAGSNGKGSVSFKIAKVLEYSGYRVGLYTSPHLFCYRERITINGEKISEEDVAAGLSRLYDPQASFFELTTFLALDYFRTKNVDIVLLETGIGGKWDPTNVVPAQLSIITSISREHVRILGEELDQIAAEKAGILKPAVPVILGPKARFQPIYDRAVELGCPCYVSKKISHFFDEENSAIAQLALQHLPPSFAVTAKAIGQGLSQRPPCRFEKKAEVILDVAHNPDAIFHLLQALHTFYPHSKFRFVVGFCKDKEYEFCLDLIADVATHVHLVQAQSPRAASPHELCEAMKKQKPSLATVHHSVEEGVAEAYAAAFSSGELLVICGSFLLMEEAARALGNQPPELSRGAKENILSSLLSSSLT